MTNLKSYDIIALEIKKKEGLIFMFEKAKKILEKGVNHKTNLFYYVRNIEEIIKNEDENFRKYMGSFSIYYQKKLINWDFFENTEQVYLIIKSSLENENFENVEYFANKLKILKNIEIDENTVFKLEYSYNKVFISLLIN